MQISRIEIPTCSSLAPNKKNQKNDMFSVLFRLHHSVDAIHLLCNAATQQQGETKMVCNMNAIEKANKAIEMGYKHIAWCESYNHGSHIPSYNISSCEKMIQNSSLSASLIQGQKLLTRINWKTTIIGDNL